MIQDIILIIIGFVILIKGADLFIDGISSTAINMKVAVQSKTATKSSLTTAFLSEMLPRKLSL